MRAAATARRDRRRKRRCLRLALPSLLAALACRERARRAWAGPVAAAPRGCPHAGRQRVALDLAGPARAAPGGRTRRTSLRAAAGGEVGVAFAIAVLSSFFNGTFPAASKLASGPPLDPVVFNGLVCAGVFVSSLLVPPIAGVPWIFTVQGFLGGVLFVFAALFSFLAIPRAGLATSQAVWSCSAIIVAFSWGAFGPAPLSEPVKDLGLSLGALLLLVAGAAVIVNAETIAQQLSGEGAAAEAGDAEGDEGEGVPEDRPSGIASALAVGLFGGSVLVPLKFVPPEAAGLLCAPSFGLGALAAGALVTAAYWKGVKGEPEWPEVPADSAGAGLLGGTIWNAGNVCSIVAQSPPYSLPYGIAYPILQCALFFGGLLGIYVFKEIQGAAVNVFWAGAALLASGIVALSLYGPGAP